MYLYICIHTICVYIHMYTCIYTHSNIKYKNKELTAKYIYEELTVVKKRPSHKCPFQLFVVQYLHISIYIHIQYI